MNHTNDRIAIVVAQFNEEITGRMADEARKELLRGGVRTNNISVHTAPGAYELPFVAKKLAKTRKFDAIVCLGCVIKGETTHDFHVASWAAIGIGQVGLETGVPVMFGVLTPKNERQARARAKPGPFNRGREVARAALDMIEINREKL